MMAKVGHCPTEASVITDMEECDRAGRFLGVEGKAHPEPPFLWSDASPKGCSFSRSDHILWFNTKGNGSHQQNVYSTSNGFKSTIVKYTNAKAVKSSTGRIYFNGSRPTSINTNAKGTSFINSRAKGGSGSSTSYTTHSSGSSTYIDRVAICRKGRTVV